MSEILLVSSDLQARTRVEAAAAAGGREVTSRVPHGGPPAEGMPPAVVVLDLDELGAELGAWVDWARADGAERRIVGFFAHVQEATGARADDLGIEVYRRGRFWRDLAKLLS
ncbi:MAG TPA: hypothetical protein VJ927_08750 [Actinomycetota bacterium]|nr:hypothetical protein [Actinomycetota bacterium]